MKDFKTDEWSLLEVREKDSDVVSFFRKNLGLDKGYFKSKFNKLVYFTVSYAPRDASGLPNNKDLDKLYKFEENVIPLLEEYADCILVASVIQKGIKDHLFYISDEDLFLKEINKHEEKLSGFNVSIEIAFDPSWQIYEDFPDDT